MFYGYWFDEMLASSPEDGAQRMDVLALPPSPHLEAAAARAASYLLK
jgi:hypothetical protein